MVDFGIYFFLAIVMVRIIYIRTLFRCLRYCRIETG